MGGADISGRSKKIIISYKRIGCGLHVMRRSACLGFCPVMNGGSASLFECTPVGRALCWPRHGAIRFMTGVTSNALRTVESPLTELRIINVKKGNQINEIKVNAINRVPQQKYQNGSIRNLITYSRDIVI